MAFLTEAATEWHIGEQAMHKTMRVPSSGNPTSPFLTPFANGVLVSSPLLALGTLDREGWPWTTLLGGEMGFARAIQRGVVGVRTLVGSQGGEEGDPVLDVLLGENGDGKGVEGMGNGKMVGALAINLEKRKRVKLFGRMIAGALMQKEEGIGEVQLVVKVEQSLGNCPKYLNKKQIVPHIPQPKLISTGPKLPQSAIDLIRKTDLFFISSSNHDADMDTNHRGGPPGFVRILSNDDDGLVFVYPEYSGNRLYQTLGNLNITPRAGLLFPDFESGDALYITGTTEILAGEAATNLIAHTNLAVKIKVVNARFVSNALAFRGQEGAFSPYNPPVRHLSSEKSLSVSSINTKIYAKLLERTIITPTIARYRFHVADPANANRWKPGQYVALNFAEELDMGYSHMRDDDPSSINDDFLRTFTVSSRQDGLSGHDQFEITVRKHGPVTEFLFRTNARAGLEVPLMGTGGEFYITQEEGESVAFVAAGVGITPLLAQAKDLDLGRLRLFWTLKGEDLSFANDTFKRIEGLAKSTTLFITGNIDRESVGWKSLEASDVTLETRRMARSDLAGTFGRYYLCTGTAMRTMLLDWLDGQTVVYEDFHY